MGRVIGCTIGDPAGVGPDVLVRAAAALAGRLPGVRLLAIGDPDVLAQRARSLGVALALRPVGAAEEVRRGPGGEAGDDTHPPVLPVLRAGRVEAGLQPGRPRAADALAALEALRAGALLAASGEIDALVTAPLNKDLVARHEPAFRGHTEWLAHHAGCADPVMLFAAPRDEQVENAADIALLSRHLPLRSALALVRRETVQRTLEVLARHWRGAFGRPPRIGVAALNPHAGEQGRLGTEEGLVLAPAILAARERGVLAAGPYPADSVFLREDLDVILALYHDQGTIMAKRAPWPTVNVTLGLPYVRTSPDHGTAYDRAATGTADAGAMAAAIRMAAWLVQRRAEEVEGAGRG